MGIPVVYTYIFRRPFTYKIPAKGPRTKCWTALVGRVVNRKPIPVFYFGRFFFGGYSRQRADMSWFGLFAANLPKPTDTLFLHGKTVRFRLRLAFILGKKIRPTWTDFPIPPYEKKGRSHFSLSVQNPARRYAFSSRLLSFSYSSHWPLFSLSLLCMYYK